MRKCVKRKKYPETEKVFRYKFSVLLGHQIEVLRRASTETFSNTNLCYISY